MAFLEASIPRFLPPDGEFNHARFVVVVQLNEMSWKLQYRFNLFRDLHKTLKHRYRKSPIPEFPKKSLSGRIDSQFLEQRRLDLQHYLKSVLLINTLRNSREINAFLAISVNKQNAEAMKRLSDVDLKSMCLLPSYDTSFRAAQNDPSCSDSDDSCSDDEIIDNTSSSTHDAYEENHDQDQDQDQGSGWVQSDNAVEEVIVWEDPLAQNTAAGNIVVVEALLRRSASMVNQKQESNGQTALHAAVFHRQTEVLALLLRSGASANLQDVDGLTALHVAAQKGYGEELGMLLAAKGVDVNKQTRSGATAMMLLCGALVHQSDRRTDRNEDETSDLVRRLIGVEGRVKTRDVMGCTALHYASASGSLKICQVLIEHGALLDAQNVDGEAPLHLAAREGQHEVVRLLTEFGADVCLESKSGKALDLVLQRRLRLSLVDHVPSVFEDGA